MSRCLDGWSRWIVKAVASSPWSSSPMASPGMIHQHSYLSLSPSWSRYIFCKLLILAGFCNVGLSTRIRTRSHICHPTLTSVSSSMTEFVFLQMYRYIMIHINAFDQCHNSCVPQVRHQHICLHTRHWGKSPHYRSFCDLKLMKNPFSRQTSIKGQVSEPSRGLWGRRSQKRRRRRKSRGKGPSPTTR